MDPTQFNLYTPVHPPAGLESPYFHVWDFHWGDIDFGPTAFDPGGRTYAVRGGYGPEEDWAGDWL